MSHNVIYNGVGSGLCCALEAEELGATGDKPRPLLVTGVAWVGCVTSSSCCFSSSSKNRKKIVIFFQRFFPKKSRSFQVIAIFSRFFVKKKN